MDPEIQEYLRILEADRRRVLLKLESDEPLRSQRSRPQQKRLKRLREDLALQVKKDLSQLRKRAFRGEVSVEATIITRVDSTSTARIVKAYLDLLKGITYADDRSIAHLMVDRFDTLPQSTAGNMALPGKEPGVEVFLTIKPLRIYKEQYQRAYLAAGDEDIYDDSLPWDSGTFGYEYYNPEEMAENIDWLLSGASEEQRRDMRSFLEQDALRVRTEVVTSLGYSPQDFPDGDVGQQLHQGLHPGLMMLPLPHRASASPPWKAELQNALEKHRNNWRSLRSPLATPLGLDIAVPRKASFIDLDNVAADIVASTEGVLDVPKGAITTYRIYWVPDSIKTIRVRLMAPSHMRTLPGIIDEVHDHFRWRD